MSSSSKEMDSRVTRHVKELFSRLPRVSGFRLGMDLAVTEVSACWGPGSNTGRGQYQLVLQAIVELVECHPEVAELMRGRTFVRSLH